MFGDESSRLQRVLGLGVCGSFVEHPIVWPSNRMVAWPSQLPVYVYHQIYVYIYIYYLHLFVIIYIYVSIVALYWCLGILVDAPISTYINSFLVALWHETERVTRSANVSLSQVSSNKPAPTEPLCPLEDSLFVCSAKSRSKKYSPNLSLFRQS